MKDRPYIQMCLTRCGKKRKISFTVRHTLRRSTLKALRRARADAGLTISELAKRAGVSRDTISNAERGLHSLQASTLHKVARALSMAPSELLAEEEKLSPKGQSRPSYELSFDDVLDNGRRTVWEAAVTEGQQLRNTGRARMWKGLSEWRASKKRNEPYADRRKYLDEMGDFLQEVYDADVALGEAYIEAALTQGGSDASGPSFLRKESRAMSHFYGELFGLVRSAGLSIRTGEGAAAAKHAAKADSETRPSGVEEGSAA